MHALQTSQQADINLPQIVDNTPSQDLVGPSEEFPRVSRALKRARDIVYESSHRMGLKFHGSGEQPQSPRLSLAT